LHSDPYSLPSQQIDQAALADVSTAQIPIAHTSADQNFISDISTAVLPVVQMMPQEKASSTLADIRTIQLPVTPMLPASQAVLQRDLIDSEIEAALSEKTNAAIAKKRLHTRFSPIAPRLTLPQKLPVQTGLSSLSQKIQAVTQRMPSITQTVQAVTQRLQAIWVKIPYRVQQLKVMTATQERSYKMLVLVWIATNLYFWYWWFQWRHIGAPILFALMTLAFFYEATVLPSFYTFYLGNMRSPKPINVNISMNAQVVKKVAVISLTVPGSEGLEIVKQQMIAMTQIEYPHESWILVDKQHSPEIQVLARKLGVLYFSRHDAATWGEANVKRWNQPVQPFKAKTKAGNVNSWIDAYGYMYSHFTQLDIDHKPLPSYLHKVLGYFLDAKIKWVQAPSVYGNLDNWTARGSAEQEFVLQGPLQMGFYGFCQTPFIIGSHCTYDMAAIREIGGFQPTRAEDHLDTVFLAANGYEGVFLPEVIAIGDGPENFETYLAQQFAWAYSMIQVLFNFTPKRIKHYTPRQALQFLFVQSWYVIWSLTMFTLFILPVIALLFNAPIAHVNYWDFLLHGLPLTVTAFMIWPWSHTWHRPHNLELSWRGVILHIARWPVVLSALVQVILRVQKPYMITVKGLQHRKHRPFPLQSHYPYFALIMLSLGACWFYLLVTKHSNAQGYLLFALQGAATILLVYITALLKDIADMIHEGISLLSSVWLRITPLLLLVVLLGTFTWTTYISCAAIYDALMTR
jgi:cellulose synthase (UDP-forming)